MASREQGSCTQRANSENDYDDQRAFTEDFYPHLLMEFSQSSLPCLSQEDVDVNLSLMEDIPAGSSVMGKGNNGEDEDGTLISKWSGDHHFGRQPLQAPGPSDPATSVPFKSWQQQASSDSVLRAGFSTRNEDSGSLLLPPFSSAFQPRQFHQLGQEISSNLQSSYDNPIHREASPEPMDTIEGGSAGLENIQPRGTAFSEDSLDMLHPRDGIVPQSFCDPSYSRNMIYQEKRIAVQGYSCLSAASDTISNPSLNEPVLGTEGTTVSQVTRFELSASESKPIFSGSELSQRENPTEVLGTCIPSVQTSFSMGNSPLEKTSDIQSSLCMMPSDIQSSSLVVFGQTSPLAASGQSSPPLAASAAGGSSATSSSVVSRPNAFPYKYREQRQFLPEGEEKKARKKRLANIRSKDFNEREKNHQKNVDSQLKIEEEKNQSLNAICQQLEGMKLRCQEIYQENKDLIP